MSAKRRNRLSNAAPIFAALGDETRLRIVARLSTDGPMSITRLTAGASVTRQAVTKHLQVLAGAGLACSSRSGRERLWELERAIGRRAPLPGWNFGTMGSST